MYPPQRPLLVSEDSPPISSTEKAPDTLVDVNTTQAKVLSVLAQASQNPDQKLETKEIAIKKICEEITDAAHKLGDVNTDNLNIQTDPSVPEPVKQKVDKMVGAASNLFRSIYRGAKKGFQALPLMLILNSDQPAPIGKQIHPGDTLKLEDLPITAKVIDWYLDGQPLAIYNHMLELKKLRKDGKMTEEEIAFKERISRNVFPDMYGAPFGEIPQLVFDAFSKDPKKSASTPLRFKRILDDTGDFTREKLERDINSGEINWRKVPSIDLLRIYMGLPQMFGTMIDSPYKPKVAKNKDAKYISFKTEDILRDMRHPEDSDKQWFEGKTWEDLKKIVKGEIDLEDRFAQESVRKQQPKMIPGVFMWFNLQHHIATIGYDNDRKEEYISYYDIWDLDVDILKGSGIDIDQFNFPPEIYGRIYKSDFDKVFEGK